MTKIAIIPGILLAGSPFIHAAPFAWTGTAADNDFFNEANWTDNGGPVAGNPFVTGAGMLGGPGAYNISGVTAPAAGFAGGVLWDTGSTVNFSASSGRFQGIFRAKPGVTLNFDNSDITANVFAEWSPANEFANQAGPFSVQWVANLVNDSDLLSSNGTVGNFAGTWFTRMTISDTSSFGTAFLVSSRVTLSGTAAELVLNDGGNALNGSLADLAAVGASVRFRNEAVANVIAEHLYGISSGSQADGITIGGRPVGFTGMTVAALGAGGSYTDPKSGAAFTLVSDGATGSILTVTALPSVAADNLVYTNASTQAKWDINALTDWDKSGTPDVFLAGDTVTFNETGLGSSPGLLGITLDATTGGVMPGAVNVALPDGYNYDFNGELYGNGALAKTGAGTLRFGPPDNSMPYGGAISLDAGVIELATHSAALRGASMTVNPGGTFRVLTNATTQDFVNPELTLNGGTLDIEDRSFFYKSIILPTGTTSTINVDVSATDGLFTWSGPNNAFGGGQGGNLIKTGIGQIELNGRNASYTGSTTIQEGSFIVNAARTAASSAWLIEETGTLLLRTDTAAPIANLAATTDVTLSGGTFDLRGNTETIENLTGGSGTLLLNAASNLTVTGVLDLTNGPTSVVIDGLTGTGSATVMNVTSINGPLTNLTTTLRNGVFSYDAGVLTVSSAPGTVTWSGSNSGEWNLATQNWLNGAVADNYFAGDTVIFTDAGSNKTINIPALVSPGGVTVTNSDVPANDYLFSGNSISGNGGFTKNGDGFVTLQNLNTFTGPTVVNGGTLFLAGGTDTLADFTTLTINPGATVEMTATNAILRSLLTDAPVIIDGGTLTQSAGVHAHIGNITLQNGATWSSTTAGNFAGVNADLDGNVTVGGTTPSTIGPFTSGIRFAILSPTFTVADVTSDAVVDLSVSASLRGTLGFTKAGPGTMFLSGNTNDYAGNTVISAGNLLIEDLLALPNDLTKVSVADGAGFGGTVGPTNLTEADIAALAAGVVWNAGGNARFVIDTKGQTVTLNSNIAGNFKILAIGGGTLNLTGTVAVVEILTDGVTTVNSGGGAATLIALDSITTGAGTLPGTRKATLAFTANGAVDIYASDDLATWGAPIATGITTSPFVQDNVTATKRFYVIVSAGQAYP
jgi:autotransporter-associated beta strand protein